MPQEVHPAGSLKQHTIWQDGQMPEPCTVVIFGATGDLTQRKLLPTLAHLLHDHPLPEGFSVVAFARRPMNDEQWRGMALDSINKYMPDNDKLDREAQHDFAQRMYYCQSDFNDREGYEKLADILERLDREKGTQGNRMYYLATPPILDSEIIFQLGGAGLARPAAGQYGDQESWTRIVIEKPFGRDLASAQKLNREIARVFHESQTYRIDHYMGKETVQNLLAFRFANGIFEPLWNQKYIDHVQIVVAESLGIGSRAEYYEEAGAIRDMVQNHIMQVLCLTTMEAPVAFDADAIRDEKVKVLRAVPLLSPEDVAKRTIRGQYTAGVINGQPQVSYKEEKGVSPASQTETYVALKLFIENWRWAEVPFYIRTGKALPKRSTEVTSWRIVDSIINAWKNMPESAVHPYQAGTWGPPEADALIQNDGREWDNP